MEAKATRPGPRRIFRRGAWQGEGQGRRDAARHAAAAIARRPGEAPGASALEAGAERLRGAVLERAAESLCVLALDGAGCRARRRCWTCKRRSRAKPSCRIRSALPCEERRRRRTANPTRIASFDPRSRARSDEVAENGGADWEVSIRAPVRGATRARHADRCRDEVSIRAPVRGATLPRTHRGADVRVSIRAPVRGATGRRLFFSQEWKVSIRAPVRGATTLAASKVRSTAFRSALPCEERPGTPR